MGKATLVLGLAAGYVLGTRDGRERYEQIKSQATRLWQDPRVQQKAAQAQDLAKEKAPVVQEKVTQAARKAGDAASGKVAQATSTDDAPTPRTAAGAAPGTAPGPAQPAPATTSPVTPPTATGDANG